MPKDASAQREHKLCWQDLVNLLSRKVPAGKITTYAEVSMWAYGRPDRNNPVNAMLRGAANHGYKSLTNRVIKSNGELATLPGGNATQRQQLNEEGVMGQNDIKVGFKVLSPVLFLGK